MFETLENKYKWLSAKVQKILEPFGQPFLFGKSPRKWCMSKEGLAWNSANLDP